MAEVTVMMPLALTPAMVAAVREDPTTKAEDWDTWHTRLGWLICAWDVLLQHRIEPFSKPPSLERVIAFLESGGSAQDAIKELRLIQAVIHPMTPNVGIEPPKVGSNEGLGVLCG